MSCTATVVTIEQVLGSEQNSQGGATYAGGGFLPGIPNKRSFIPPCSVNGVNEFVEIHGALITCFNHVTPSDGDWDCSMVDPNAPAGVTTYMKKIHIETDKKFQAASGWSVPPKNTPVDVQGFVYWDPNHTTDARHSYSGWELHSLTAWRTAVNPTTAQPDVGPFAVDTLKQDGPLLEDDR